MPMGLCVAAAIVASLSAMRAGSGGGVALSRRPSALARQAVVSLCAPDAPEPAVSSILDLEQFGRVKEAAEVVQIMAARARGRGKEANDALIRELLDAPNVDAAIQLHYDWVSSIKFLRALQVRIEAATTSPYAQGSSTMDANVGSKGGSAAQAERLRALVELMARVRAEVQTRMDAAARLIATQLPAIAADPLAMRVLARRGLLDEALVAMLVAHAERAGKVARARASEGSNAEELEGVERARTLLQRLAQDAMRELDLPVAGEFLVLRRLLQVRTAPARTELARRAVAGDRLVTDRPVDISKLIEVAREFRNMEQEADRPDAEVAQKLAVVERELVAIAREAGGGTRPDLGGAGPFRP